MNNHLQSLLKEMSDDSYRSGEWSEEGVFESGKTVSWTAYEKARQLTDTSYLPELYNLVETSKAEEEKTHAYFIIGFIAKNSNDEQATKFLLDRLKVEKSTSTINLILHRLEDLYKPAHFDLSIIYQLINKKGALTRHAAYMALTNTGHSVEAPLLELLQKTTEREDIIWLIRALRYVGTEKSIDVLKTYVKHKKLRIREVVRDELVTIMLRAGKPMTEICRLTKMPTQIVENRKERISILTRPG
jgi:hypothetical protein